MTNIKIYRGDIEKLNFVFTKDNAPIDITGYTVTLTIKKEKGGQLVLQKQQTTHTDPTNGKTEIVLDSTDTDLEEGFYVYDILLEKGTEFKKTILVDRIEILKTAR